MQSNTWLKYAAYLVGGLLALWLLGMILKMLGGLFLGLTAMLWSLLQFLLVAAVIVGVVYLLVQLFKKKS